MLSHLVRTAIRGLDIAYAALCVAFATGRQRVGGLTVAKDATSWFQRAFKLLVFDITFFFVYLSIPIATYLIVSGASRPLLTL